VAIEVKAIVGDDHMTADRKDRVMLILRQQPVTPAQRRYLFARWCRLVKCDATLHDLDQVAAYDAR